MAAKKLSPRTEALVDLWLVSERLSSLAEHRIGAVHGIGYVEFMVLLQLSAAPEGSMRRVDLAQAIGRTASGVTRLLKPMEKTGLVARGSSERDARVRLVRLTDAGGGRLREALDTVDGSACCCRSATQRWTRCDGDWRC